MAISKEELDLLLKQIDFNKIPAEVYSYEEDFLEKQRANFRSNYGTVKNYLAIYYYFTFVEQKEKSEVARLLGIRAETVHTNLLNLGWSFSNDWDTNKHLREEKLMYGFKMREAVKNISSKEETELNEVLKKVKKYKNQRQFRYFTSEEEYIRVLAYYSCIKKLSRKQLARITGDNYNTIATRLVNYGINNTVEEGYRRKKENGTQDYHRTIIAGKTTTRKAQVDNLSSGSEKQLYARNYLADKIGIYFSPEEFDAIVGCSNTGILGAKEIDIPIIIYNIKSKKLIRIALEYNGDPFHDEEKDMEKKKMANNRGWFYIRLIDKSEYSNGLSKLDQILHKIMKDLRELTSYSVDDVSVLEVKDLY